MQVTSKEWRLTGECCHLYQAAKDAPSLSWACSPMEGGTQQHCLWILAKGMKS